MYKNRQMTLHDMRHLIMLLYNMKYTPPVKHYVIAKHCTKDTNKTPNILVIVWLHISQLISVSKNFQVKSLQQQRVNNPLHSYLFIFVVSGNNSKEESGLCECSTSEEPGIFLQTRSRK